MSAGIRRHEDLKESRITNRPGDDDLVFMKTNEIHLNNEIIRLKSEIKILSEINTRLNKELVYYQSTLGISAHDDIIKSEERNASDIIKLPAHLAEFDFILPLLASYDHKMDSLEGALAKASEDMIELEKKSEKIINDNNILRVQLEKKCQTILDIYRTGHGDENIGVMFNKLEKEDMNERMRLLSEENNLLISNLKELNTKFNNATRASEEKNEEFSDVMTRYSELSKRNKQLELDLEDNKKMKDILEVRYKNMTDDASKLENEKEELLNKINRYENEIKLQKNQINSSKKTFNEYEEKKSSEMELLRKELDALKLREREYANKLVFIERDLDSSKEENRKLRKELDNSKNEAENVLKMVETYEAKVQNYKKKEQDVARISKESKERVEEALLQRDRILLKEEHYQKTIEQMNETHRQEVQSLKEQYDRSLNNTRNKNKTALDSREQEIKHLSEEVSKLSAQNDKLQKEIKSLTADYNKLNNSLKDTTGLKEQRYEEYDRKINDLEDKLLQSRSEYDDRVRSLTQEKSNLESSHRQLQTSMSEIKSNIESLRSQNNTLVSENSALKTKLTTSQRERQSFVDEIDKIKKNYTTQMEIFSDDYQEKMKDIEEKLREAERKERSAREFVVELVKEHEKIEQSFVQENKKTIQYYEKRLSDVENHATMKMKGR